MIKFIVFGILSVFLIAGCEVKNEEVKNETESTNKIRTFEETQKYLLSAGWKEDKDELEKKNTYRKSINTKQSCKPLYNLIAIVDSNKNFFNKDINLLFQGYDKNSVDANEFIWRDNESTIRKKVTCENDYKTLTLLGVSSSGYYLYCIVDDINIDEAISLSRTDYMRIKGTGFTQDIKPDTEECKELFGHVIDTTNSFISALVEE